jgi:tetratricopeptide (TPR) repeat protein
MTLVDQKETSPGARFRRYARWVQRQRARASRIASHISSLDLPPVTVDAVRRLYPKSVSIGLSWELTRIAHEFATRVPKKARSLSLLAANVASVVPAPQRFPYASLHAEGEAWIRHAAALFHLGQLHESREAAEKAECLLGAAGPVAIRSTATLCLTLGKILHYLGDADTALALVDKGAKIILHLFNETDKYVEAMTIYTALLMRSGRYADAAQIWDDLAAAARKANDSKTLAYILNNIGLMYLTMRKIDLANECFRTALAMFEELGLATEVPRVRGGLALALAQEGCFDEAIVQIYRNRDAFMALGMPHEAASAMLRVIETKFAAGQLADIPRLCAETHSFFHALGLTAEARKAAGYLLEAARQMKLRVTDVQLVDSFVLSLKYSPEAQFTAPS